MIWENDKGTIIKAKEIHIEESAVLGSDISVDINGIFRLGKRSVLGDRAVIRGNNVIFGDDLFNSSDLRIGWGGAENPNANLTIGDRCTCHDNLLNVFEPIEIGNDVGLSNEVAIYTHGYWMSVLEGYPAQFAGVIIEDKVIVGYRSIILMDVIIGEGAVIGAGSVVVKSVESKSIVAGNPAKFIGKVIPVEDRNERESMVRIILAKYDKVAVFHGINPTIDVEYPFVRVNNSLFNVETLEWKGEDDAEVDDFRDYVRHWGLRFYGRPFKSASVQV